MDVSSLASPARPPGPDGLVWAVRYPPDAPPVLADHALPPGPGWTWLHFDLVNSAAHAAIAADPRLPDFARAALTGADETLRLDVDIACDDCFAGVLPGFLRSAAEDADEITFWHFALLPDLLVTARRRATRSLANAWDAARRGHRPPGPQALVDSLIGDFAHELRGRAAGLAATLDPIEDRLLGDARAHELGGIATGIGQVRRHAARLRRAVAPLARLMEEDLDSLPTWTQAPSHDAAHRQVRAVLDDLTALQDRARALQDELAARQTEETNRRLYLVSVVTTLVMPASFVTGFFGMNTGGLPLNEAPHGTLIAGAICVAAVAVTLALLRLRRLL